MKTILVPTDFSLAATNGLAYAKRLATNHGYYLKILHIVPTIVDPNMPPEIIDDILLNQEKEATASCEELQKELIDAGLETEFVCRRGFLVEAEILDEIAKGGINLVVMGTKGRSDITTVLLGSNTSSIIDKSECPVLIVPVNADPKKAIKKIVYATQLHGDELPFVERITAFAKSLKAETTLLKVSTTAKEEELLLNELDLTSKRFHCKLETCHAPNVGIGISNYIIENDVDLLVMITHKRSMLEKVFSPSVTKNLAEQLNVPLLSYHA